MNIETRYNTSEENIKEWKIYYIEVNMWPFTKEEYYEKMNFLKTLKK